MAKVAAEMAKVAAEMAEVVAKEAAVLVSLREEAAVEAGSKSSSNLRA